MRTITLLGVRRREPTSPSDGRSVHVLLPRDQQRRMEFRRRIGLVSLVKTHVPARALLTRTATESIRPECNGDHIDNGGSGSAEGSLTRKESTVATSVHDPHPHPQSSLGNPEETASAAALFTSGQPAAKPASNETRPSELMQSLCGLAANPTRIKASANGTIRPHRVWTIAPGET